MLIILYKNTSADPLPLPYRLVAASSAAIVSAVVTTPLDVLKTRIQTSPMTMLQGHTLHAQYVYFI